MTLADQVLARDDARLSATVASDAAALEDLLDESFTYVHSNGFREGREPYLRRIRDGQVAYVSLDRREATVRLFGDTALVEGVAALRYRLAGSAGAEGFESLFLGVWVRPAGVWRLAAYTSTLLPPPA
jgi:hypothetical protein